MSDLVDKIEQLHKGLLSLKQNQKKDAFVAAIKLPTLNTKIPTSGAKIPGTLPPPSKKDPVKVAQQLKNPRPGKVQMEILKVEDNGQWSLEKSDEIPSTHLAPRSEGGTRIEGMSPEKQAKISTRMQSVNAPVDAEKHGWTQLHTPAQNSLIHGLKLNDAVPASKGKQGAAFASSDAHPEVALVKNSVNHEDRKIRGHLKNNFNSAKREVLYHNLARDYFGMGQHVPTTAGFTKNGDDWSAQRKVDNASHPDVRVDNTTIPTRNKANEPYLSNSNHTKVLQRLNNQGTLDKLALMDHIMGHHDRHGGNLLVDDAGDNMHLIDNGTAFDYENLDSHPIPRYRQLVQYSDIRGKDGHNNAKLHPEAKKWLENLSVDKAKELLAKNGHDSNSPATKGVLDRLVGLKNKIAKGTYDKPNVSVDKMLLDNSRKN